MPTTNGQPLPLLPHFYTDFLFYRATPPNKLLIRVISWEEEHSYITKYTDEWLSLPRQTETRQDTDSAALGQVPKVSETTEVKGLIGLKQSWRTGQETKILLYFTEMSSYLTPSLYSKNGLENQWLNTIWNTHDLCCGCNDCFKHLWHILQKKNNLPCLPSTSTEDAGTQTDGEDHGDGFDEGDLDKLFEEDFEEDTG